MRPQYDRSVDYFFFLRVHIKAENWSAPLDDSDSKSDLFSGASGQFGFVLDFWTLSSCEFTRNHVVIDKANGPTFQFDEESEFPEISPLHPSVFWKLGISELGMPL